MERYYRISELIPNKGSGKKRIVPFSRSTWWNGVKDGRFPQPVKFGPRITAWKESDIRNLLENGLSD